MSSSDPADPFAPGTVLAGKYEVLVELGRGSFGRVLRARDASLGRMAAIKILDPRVASPEIQERFLREARITSSLRHAHIVTVYELGYHRGAAFIAYEHVDGRDLEALIKDGTAVPEPTLMEWGRQVAEALGHAHRAGVIHRDVKPANVLLRGGNHPIVCDFGIAKATFSGAVHTATGVILGTPGYLAPEVWMGEPPTPAADQYAWAATLYELLYRQMVHGNASPTEIVDRIRAGTPPTIPIEHRGRLPGVEATLLRALATCPQDRFKDMDGMAAALSTALTAVPELAALTVEGPSQGTDPGRTSMAEPLRVEIRKGAPPSRAAPPSRVDPPGRAGPASRIGPPSRVDPPRSRAEILLRPAPLPWGRITLAAGSVALALGLWLGPVRAPSAGRDGGDQARPDPYLSVELQRYRTRLAETSKVFLASHEVEDRTLTLTYHTGERRYEAHHSEKRMEKIVDEAFAEAWKPYFEAVQDWMHGLKAWETDQGRPGASWDQPQVRADWDRFVFGLAVHLLEDFRIYEDELILSHLATLKSLDFWATSQAANPQVKALREFTQTLLLSQEVWGRSSAPDPYLAFEGLVPALLDHDLADHALVEALADRYRDAPPDVRCAWLAKAMLYQLCTSPSEKRLTWSQRNEALKVLASRVLVPDRWTDPEARARILGRTVIEECRSARVISADPKHSLQDMARVGTLLDALEEQVPLFPALVERSADVAQRVLSAGGPFYVEESPPERYLPWRARLDRLQHAAAKASRTAAAARGG